MVYNFGPVSQYSVYQIITLENLDVASSYLHTQYGIRVKFVNEGHRVKVKVTNACQCINFHWYSPGGATGHTVWVVML